METISNPHDVFFRESFGRREIAQDFLRHQLPAELLQGLDLDSLEISKDSYVSSDLRASYSDLVYRLRSNDPNQNPALFVYMLFEHKSSPEHWVLLQLLRYYVQGTQRVAEDDARRLLQQTAPGDPIMLTFIDRYIEQGIQQGRRQGEAEVLLRQLERKFGPADARLRQRILDADAETLLEWSEHILTAETPDAVFQAH